MRLFLNSSMSLWCVPTVFDVGSIKVISQTNCHLMKKRNEQDRLFATPTFPIFFTTTIATGWFVEMVVIFLPCFQNFLSLFSSFVERKLYPVQSLYVFSR